MQWHRDMQSDLGSRRWSQSTRLSSLRLAKQTHDPIRCASQPLRGVGATAWFTPPVPRKGHPGTLLHESWRRCIRQRHQEDLLALHSRLQAAVWGERDASERRFWAHVLQGPQLLGADASDWPRRSAESWTRHWYPAAREIKESAPAFDLWAGGRARLLDMHPLRRSWSTLGGCLCLPIIHVAMHVCPAYSVISIRCMRSSITTLVQRASPGARGRRRVQLQHEQDLAERELDRGVA
jgi:hypothetical protein